MELYAKNGSILNGLSEPEECPPRTLQGLTALATSVGIQGGVGTALFAIASMFAVVVICDAQGVRRATGKQAEVLNKIVDDIYRHKKVEDARLKELIGHTPVQVFFGIFVGLMVAFISYSL